MDFIDQKNNLRAGLKAKRKNLSDLQVIDLSQQIAERLIGFADWKNIKTLHIYESIAKNNEVDTRLIIDFCKKNWPQIKIYHPRDTTNKSKQFDLIIVPLVGFDRSGNRLGYGGGYYDKFLSATSSGQIVGFAYSSQEVNHLPTDPHDQKLDVIITEKEIIKAF